MTARASAGFTLVEVLVALVVIAFGLLGMAALQANTLSTTSGARYESIVAVEAQSMADAITANPGYWADGLFSTTPISVTSKNSTTVLSDPTLSSITKDCSSSTCSPTELASYDLRQWGDDLRQQIPGASGIVACQIGTPDTCKITINWRMKIAAAVNTGTQATNSTTATAKTYSLVSVL
ncbi:type IV pilus modification protein PilV [Mangrovitalea sediminis]|uniref:type IV pilus modification protein PilV n=1 Tax=Mangrovitalea sediminis TaxID=1982043 RepID=UPI000BE604FE|nr:type IV pilus modification protein PilV [Mangrovitalea sediminis]